MTTSLRPSTRTRRGDVERVGHSISHPDAPSAEDPLKGASSPDATTFSSPTHTSCVDLQAAYGSRFKIRKEADGITWNETPERERVWLLELPCKHGVIHPQGDDILAATITSRKIGKMVAALPCIRTSRGDVERVVTFHVDDADAVLELLRPSRRRQISPEERDRLVAIGQHHRFHGAQVSKTGLESTQTLEDSPEGQPELDVIVAAPDVVPSQHRRHDRQVRG